MKTFEGIDFPFVSLERGFWHRKQELIRDATLPTVERVFRDTHRFDAFRFDWKPGMDWKPHIFWDSDIAKWAESVAYVLRRGRDEALERSVDEVVAQIREHQDPSGYFNIHFTVVEPDFRFQKRTEHELYCAGHLIEAAVAYFEATAKDAFLKAMCRYADHIDQVFRLDGSAAFETCGHEEIELALVRLYRCTREPRYLDLARFFLDRRGRSGKDARAFYPWANARYAQDHAPVREQATAEGHAVRSMYLCCAMADLALEDGDEALLDACRRIFRNVSGRRMYVTGAIGSSHLGEAFTVDYDLPNGEAYAETCAAIGLMLFSRRMLRLEPDAHYADVAERALYNGFLSGLSLDGRSFFYENPLEIDPAMRARDASVEDGRPHFPLMERIGDFNCSCCPPNITRFIASIGDMLYTVADDCLYVHHYMDSRTEAPIAGGQVSIRQETAYPVDGAVRIVASGLAGRRLAVRIPEWCTGATIRIDGVEAGYRLERGYADLGPVGDGVVVELDLPMVPFLVEASPHVQADAGRVALQRGPVVHCLEGVDNGSDLRDLGVTLPLRNVAMRFEEAFGTFVVETDGSARDAASFGDRLYRPVVAEESPRRLTFIPYYAFANRGASGMLVWVRVRD